MTRWPVSKISRAMGSVSRRSSSLRAFSRNPVTCVTRRDIAEPNASHTLGSAALHSSCPRAVSGKPVTFVPGRESVELKALNDQSSTVKKRLPHLQRAALKKALRRNDELKVDGWRKLLGACAIALLLNPIAVAAATVQVEASGAVAAAGVQTLKDGARLSDAALAAKPLPQAYMEGAAWLRSGLLKPQERLKAGILFDLVSLRQRAQHRSQQGIAAFAERLMDMIKPMPVTGRQVALLDPRAVEVNAPENHPVADGDKLYYPARPSTIRVVGAVQHTCELPLVPLQSAAHYLANCVVAAEADRDIIYVIEPDGRVFVQGIALWNRSTPLVLAPGALVYVPLRARAIKPVDPTLNSDIAAFLATQLLPGPGAH